MSAEAIFGNWLVAIAEAVEVVGASDLDSASVAEMTKAWGLVRKAADITLDELSARIAAQEHLEVADLEAADVRAAVLVPAEVAHRRNVLPLRCTDREVYIATANPMSQDAKREIAALAGRVVVFQIAAPNDIASTVGETYGAPAHPPPAGHPKRPEVVRPSGPHILVVDDEAGARALFRSVLEGGGFRVDVAKDGPEAVAMLEGDSTYDLVTLDYWMDKMNGLRVLQHLRSHPQLRSMPVIMVTAAGDRQIEMSLFEAGADDYIAKPIDPPLFLLRIQAVLRRRTFA